MVIALRGWFDIAEVATTAINELLDRSDRADRRVDRPRSVLRLHPGAPARRARRRRDPPHPLAAQRVPLRPLPGQHHTTSSCSPASSRTCATRPSPTACSRSPSCRSARSSSRSAPSPTPSRTPDRRWSSAAPPTPSLSTALGLSPPRTRASPGLVGVLQERLDRAGVPAVSLRVGVPHYLGNASTRSRRSPCCSTSTTCSACRCTPLASRRSGASPGAARRGRRRGRASQRVRRHARARIRPAGRGSHPVGRRSGRRVRTLPPRPARRRGLKRSGWPTPSRSSRFRNLPAGLRGSGSSTKTDPRRDHERGDLRPQELRAVRRRSASLRRRGGSPRRPPRRAARRESPNTAASWTAGCS